MEGSTTEIVTRLVLQLGAILLAGKVGSELSERLFKQPGVLGELVAGMVIGPFALGGVPLPVIGAIFPPISGTGTGVSYIPVTVPLYAVAQIGAVVLLFYAGLGTDFQQFFRFGGPAAIIATGGVVVPFFLGNLATVAFGLASGPMDPKALFVGTIMTATSVGISARVLSDIGKLDTPEGVTILAGAVIDDVLGILVLTIVGGLVAGGGVSAADVALIGGKALGFWLGLTAVGILLSRYISRLFLSFKSDGAILGLSLALAFFCSVIAQQAGLAMIVGAYSIGLALSQTEIAERLSEPLGSVYHALVPVFFVVMGMLVNFQAMAPVLLFGGTITILAMAGKILGCGLPALAVGFNRAGAIRVGIGMLPRGEVALIVAGVGLTTGLIQSNIFGVAIMMTIVTTLVAPVALVPVFRRDIPGLRGRPETGHASAATQLNGRPE